MKLKGHTEGDVELIKRHSEHATTTTTFTTAISSTTSSTTTTKAKGIKVKTSWDIEGEYKLNQNTLLPQVVKRGKSVMY